VADAERMTCGPFGILLFVLRGLLRQCCCGPHWRVSFNRHGYCYWIASSGASQISCGLPACDCLKFFFSDRDV